MAIVERRHGVGRYTQLREIAAGALGRSKLTPTEYYQYGVFRPDLTRQQKAGFFSDRSNAAFNRDLSPPELGAVPGVMRDKGLCGILLRGYGYPVPKTLALFSVDGRYGRRNALSSAKDIVDFLRATDTWPMFCKPTSAGQGIGAASLTGLTPDGAKITFGDDRVVPIDDFAREIEKNFPRGFAFQELCQQDPAIEAVTGPAVGVVRITTVLTLDGPEFLYGTWKFPGVGAMSDGVQAGAGPTGMGYIDPETARITGAHFGDRISGEDGAVSPVTGAAIVGTEVARFKDCVALGVDAHSVFPTHGIVGWDMIVTASGPLIGEANPNPFHMVVQRSLGRPWDDPDLLATLEKAKAHRDWRRAEAKRLGGMAPWSA